jgi:hypothetical protein
MSPPGDQDAAGQWAGETGSAKRRLRVASSQERLPTDIPERAGEPPSYDTGIVYSIEIVEGRRWGRNRLSATTKATTFDSALNAKGSGAEG